MVGYSARTLLLVILHMCSRCVPGPFPGVGGGGGGGGGAWARGYDLLCMQDTVAWHAVTLNKPVYLVAIMHAHNYNI